MLKVRVIPTLLFKNLGLVKGQSFNSWRRVGTALQSVRVYNLRDVDELIFLDITATCENRPPDLETVQEIAQECFMPLTVGGGIRSVDDVRNLLKAGADKISLNSAAVARPDLIREISEQFGAQCVVVSIDAKRRPDGTYETYSKSGTVPTGRDPLAFAQEAEHLGAGEILITSIERDGTLLGYDVELIKKISSAVKIPVIAAGGAGKLEHLLEAIRDGGASALAAAAIFHFTEITPIEVKRYLRENGVETRVQL